MKRFIYLIAVVLTLGALVAAAGRGYNVAGWHALVAQWRPIVDCGGSWQEDLELRSKTPYCQLVQDGCLWGCDKSISKTGLYYFDGQVTRLGARCEAGGASPYFYPTNYVWGDGTNIYVPATTSTIQTVTKRVTSGTFVQGELCTQEVTNARGWFMRWDGNDMKMHRYSGTFVAEGAAGDRTISAPSGAETEPNAASSLAGQSVLLSTATPKVNGGRSLKSRIDFKDKLIQRAFVDCGVIDGSKLLLYFSSKNIEAGGFTKDIWWNRPTVDTNWTLLMEVDDDKGFEHFHGAVMVRDVNGVGSSHKLYIMSGDSNEGSSVLVCNDLVDLLANPGDWKTNFGWDLVHDSTRDAYLTTGAGAEYCVLTGSQSARTYDIVADEDNRFAYWIPDTSSDSYAYKLDMTTDTAEQLSTLIPCEGAFGCLLSNGAILFGSSTSWSGSSWSGDEYHRIWALNEAEDNFVVVWKAIRRDAADPATGLAWWTSISEYPVASSTDDTATVWFSGVPAGRLPAGDSIVGHYKRSTVGLTGSSSVNAEARTFKPPLVNLLVNSRFADDSWPEFTFTNAVDAQETTIVDSDEGQKYALKVTPTGVSADATYTLPPNVLETVRGKWITIRVRVYKNTTSTVYIKWEDGIQTKLSSPSSFTSAAEYQTTDIQGFVSSAATKGEIVLYARYGSGGANDPVYFSDLQMVIGARHNLLPPSIPSMHDFFGYDVSSKTHALVLICDHADFIDNGDATGRMDFINAIPAYSEVLSVKVDCSAAFNSDNTSSVDVEVGTAGDPDAFHDQTNGEDIVGADWDDGWKGADVEDPAVLVAATTPRIKITEDDDMTDLISDSGAQGTMVVTIIFRKL